MSLFDKWTGRVSGFLDDVLLPDELRTTLKRAQKALREDDPAEALRLLDQIDAARPNLGRVAELRGAALLLLERWPEAADALRRAAQQRPEPRTLRALANALEQAGDARAARDVLREALHRDPEPDDRFALHRALARLYAHTGRADKATRELKKALRVAQDHPDAALPLANAAAALANALLDRREHAHARLVLLDAFPDQLDGPPRPEALDDDALHALARLHLHERRPLDALALLRALLDRHPEDRAALHALAQAALAAELPQQALDALASAQDSRDPALLALRGRALLALRQHAAALDALNAALEQRPQDRDALTAAAWAQLHLAMDGPDPDAWRRAEDRFAAALALHPEDPGALHGAGRCRAWRGDHVGARRLLQAAIDAGAPPPARLDLANALLHSGAPADAIAAIASLLALPQRLDPDAALTLQARDALASAHAALSAPISPPPPGSRDLDALTAALRALLHRAASPRLVHLLPAARAALDALDAPLDLAIVGEFNAGKSTLVNALLGEEIVPMGVLPTTAHLQIMRAGPRRAAQLHLKDGTLKEIPFKDVRAAVRRDDADRAIDHIEYLYPHPELRRVHLWDTPGFNALDPDHERHARAALASAQAIVWLLDANQALKDSEWALLDAIPAAAERLLIVLNKVDAFGDGDDRRAAIDALMAHVQPALAGRCMAILPLSGLEGLRARQGQDGALLASSGLAALDAFLHDEIYERAATFKAIDADRALTALCAQIGARSRALEALLEERQRHLDALLRGIDAEQDNLLRDALPEALERLRDGADLLLGVMARELEEALQPGSTLVDALLTRMGLDDEDIAFLLSLTRERHDGLLDRSRDRLLAALLDAERRLVDGLDALIAAAPPEDTRALQARLRAWMDRARAHRDALEPQVFGPWRAFAAGRLTAPGAPDLIRRAASRETRQDARQSALRPLLPEVDAERAAALQTWVEEYFLSARRFCDTLRGDLQVIAIEALALRAGLEARQNHTEAHVPDTPQA